MFTIRYKLAYIHGYIDRPECRVQIGTGSMFMIRCKSIHAAKCLATRLSRAISKEMSNGQ